MYVKSLPLGPIKPTFNDVSCYLIPTLFSATPIPGEKATKSQ